MGDDLKRKRPEDPTKINTSQDWEVDYWSKTFGVSKERLLAAVKAVGNSVAAVRRYLGK